MSLNLRLFCWVWTAIFHDLRKRINDLWSTKTLHHRHVSVPDTLKHKVRFSDSQWWSGWETLTVKQVNGVSPAKYQFSSYKPAAAAQTIPDLSSQRHFSNYIHILSKEGGGINICQIKMLTTIASVSSVSACLPPSAQQTTDNMFPSSWRWHVVHMTPFFHTA